ncbi:MAG: hypothetical protein ACE5K4_12685, partial [Candidatus Hydrothermarchaeota archaeon]
MRKIVHESIIQGVNPTLAVTIAMKESSLGDNPKADNIFQLTEKAGIKGGKNYYKIMVARGKEDADVQIEVGIMALKEHYIPKAEESVRYEAGADNFSWAENVYGTFLGWTGWRTGSWVDKKGNRHYYADDVKKYSPTKIE